MTQLFWYAFQTAIFFGTIYFYIEIVPSPETSLGSKALFGAILAYFLTCLLAKCGELLARYLRRIKKSGYLSRPNFLRRKLPH